MSRLVDIYARVSPRLSNRPGAAAATRAHAWLLRRSRGRIGRRFLGADVLVLRTRGRKSGQVRNAPMFFVRDGRNFAVVASNAAAERPPAWWLNLQASPDAEVFADGRVHQVRGRRGTPAEAERLWPRLAASYSGYDHYRSIAKREMPVVILEERSP